MKQLLFLCLLACVALHAQQTPPPTGLPGHPFFVKQTWTIGGEGDWDYLTLDSAARRLYIAHHHTVQVVDVQSGTLAGTIAGFGEARFIALDASGQFGYVSDSESRDVKVFDRGTLQIVAAVPVGFGPRTMAFEPQTGLLVVIGAEPLGADSTEASSTASNSGSGARTGSQNARRPQPPHRQSACGDSVSGTRFAAAHRSMVSFIDTDKRVVLGDLRLCGTLGFAQADGNGMVYANIVDMYQVARLDANSIRSLLTDKASDASAPAGPLLASFRTEGTLHLDWTRIGYPLSTRPASGQSATSGQDHADFYLQEVPQLHLFNLGSGCVEPQGLALDTQHARLFAACSNLTMTVLNTANGELVATVPIGAGAGSIGYDPERSLIFSANGGGTGTLTVVSQTETDSYAVVQILPTLPNAGTMAVDASSAQVYLATVLSGVSLEHPPAQGIRTLRIKPVDASFQVMVVGN